MKILCLLAMRGGSKGVKHKNFINLNNKPLFLYTLEQAKKTNLFKHIVVSSDSNQILKKISKHNVDLLIKRNKNLALDNSPKISVIKDALKKSEKYFEIKYDYIFDLDVTSPLRKITDIQKAFKKIKHSTNALNLVSVCKADKNPYFNMIEKNKEKVHISKKIYRNIHSRQKAPQVYELNASIYIWRRKALLSKIKLINDRTIVYIMPKSRSIDIDDSFDLKLVRFLIK